ncbi:N-acetylmuramoyl-L-alanine amidase [Paenibacillus ferrarius]|uniref:N-acetylmuramoyl-L-alanine amidase n=1 Tax=Paenibacillus ferrarius TaxID=1469647 RepID=UPI003D2DCACC
MNFRSMILLSLVLLTVLFPQSAFAYKVVLDAGHGGYDSGAVGVNGLKEKDVNLDITLKLKQALLDRGYEVVLTRTDDTFWSLAERVQYTTEQKADFFVSIHANANPGSSAKGSMVLYYDNAYPQEDYPASAAMEKLTPYSKDLAQKVLDSLVGAAGTKDLGLVPSAVYVARMGEIPSILVETAFLSNKSDAALLADDAVRLRMATGIADGISAYAPPVFTDLLGHWSRDAVLRMKGKGVIDGIGGNRYEPDRALTRAEFLTLMDRVFKLDSLPASCAYSGSVTGSVYGGACQPAPAMSFKDLPATHWASAVFTKASKLNLLQGYSDGTIRPNQAITRGEVAYLFERLLAESAGTKPAVAAPKNAGFTDVPATLWSAPAIYALKSKGIINGYTDTEFYPDQTMTRAEAAALIDRYMSK